MQITIFVDISIASGEIERLVSMAKILSVVLMPTRVSSLLCSPTWLNGMLFHHAIFTKHSSTIEMIYSNLSCFFYFNIYDHLQDRIK